MKVKVVKNKWGFKFSVVPLIILVLFIWAVTLINLRGIFPGGIAPVDIYSPATENIVADHDRNWVNLDRPTMDELRVTLEADDVMMSGVAPVENIKSLRNWTRQRASGPNDYSIQTEDPCLILSNLESGEGVYCKPLADLYVAALTVYGFPARRVSFFAEIGDFDKSHASVEVWTGEKWVVQDPFFNCSVRDVSGEMLSAMEIHDAYKSGHEVNWVQDVDETEPVMESYVHPPEELCSIVMYRLHGPRYLESGKELLLNRFIDRLTGRIDTIIVTSDPLPMSPLVYTGLVDRYLAGILILLIVIPILIRFKKS